jgi:hypothetical protein
MNAIEAGVHFAAQLHDLRAGIAQEFSQVGAAGAVHGIHHHTQLAAANRLEIHQRRQVIAIRGPWVEALDQALGLRVIEIQDQRLAAFLLVLLQARFHQFAVRRGGGAAIRGLELDAVVAGRIVTGRNHDAALRLVQDDGM